MYVYGLVSFDFPTGYLDYSDGKFELHTRINNVGNDGVLELYGSGSDPVALVRKAQNSHSKIVFRPFAEAELKKRGIDMEKELPTATGSDLVNKITAVLSNEPADASETSEQETPSVTDRIAQVLGESSLAYAYPSVVGGERPKSRYCCFASVPVPDDAASEVASAIRRFGGEISYSVSTPQYEDSVCACVGVGFADSEKALAFESWYNEQEYESNKDRRLFILISTPNKMNESEDGESSGFTFVAKCGDEETANDFAAGLEELDATDIEVNGTDVSFSLSGFSDEELDDVLEVISVLANDLEIDITQEDDEEEDDEDDEEEETHEGTAVRTAGMEMATGKKVNEASGCHIGGKAKGRAKKAGQRGAYSLVREDNKDSSESKENPRKLPNYKPSGAGSEEIKRKKDRKLLNYKPKGAGAEEVRREQARMRKERELKGDYSHYASMREDKPVEEKSRCWNGYKPKPGKKPYSKGSCMKEDQPSVRERIAEVLGIKTEGSIAVLVAAMKHKKKKKANEGTAVRTAGMEMATGKKVTESTIPVKEAAKEFTWVRDENGNMNLQDVSYPRGKNWSWKVASRSDDGEIEEIKITSPSKKTKTLMVNNRSQRTKKLINDLQSTKSQDAVNDILYRFDRSMRERP